MMKQMCGRGITGKGNGFDACNLCLVNQQSEFSSTLMRAFSTQDSAAVLHMQMQNHNEIIQELAYTTLWCWGTSCSHFDVNDNSI